MTCHPPVHLPADALFRQAGISLDDGQPDPGPAG
jgi:hypothetical protein